MSITRWSGSNLTKKKLEEVLKNNPQAIVAQDKDGWTLLHHAINLKEQSLSSSGMIFNIIFNAPGVNFTLKDSEGNTPVHLVAQASSQNSANSENIFADYVKEASKNGFDFSTLNNDGKTVLHLAIEPPRNNIKFCINNKVKSFLDNATNPQIDTLSKVGATALFDAIKSGYFDVAKTLLEANANPLAGSENYKPINSLNEQIKDFKEALERASNEEIQDLKDKVAELEEISLMMKVSVAKEEIKKNAEILLEGCQDANSQLCVLPPEIAVLIAAKTGGEILSESESYQIAVGTMPKHHIKFFEQKRQMINSEAKKENLEQFQVPQI